MLFAVELQVAGGMEAVVTGQDSTRDFSCYFRILKL